MSGVSDWHSNLSPEGRVAAAKTLPLSRFVAEQEGRGMLLVSLKDGTAKFLAMLSLVDSERCYRIVSGLIDTQTRLAEPVGDTWPSELAQSFDEDALAGLLEKTCHFAVVLRKRSQSETQELSRVTIGRAKDNDIVLSHPTISKLHAWFEVEEDGAHWVTDKGSRNGTRINGQRIAPDCPAVLEPGDRIDFGLVRTVFCPATTFWRALQH
jgi:hypothetical protein